MGETEASATAIVAELSRLDSWLQRCTSTQIKAVRLEQLAILISNTVLRQQLQITAARPGHNVVTRGAQLFVFKFTVGIISCPAIIKYAPASQTPQIALACSRSGVLHNPSLLPELSWGSPEP